MAVLFRGLILASRQAPKQEPALSPFAVTAAEGHQDPEGVPGWEERRAWADLRQFGYVLFWSE